MYLNTVICWWMLCYAILSFNSSFIYDISHSVYFTLAISHYVHTGYASARFPHFTHSLRVLTLWICTSRYIIVTFCWSGIWRGYWYYEEPEFLLARSSILGILSYILFILLISFDSLYILDSVIVLLIIHKITYHCVKIYMFIVVILIIIVGSYTLFRSL